MAHVTAFNKAFWASPAVCKIKTETGTADILATRASLANDLESVLNATNPLNKTALEASSRLLAAFGKTGKHEDKITLGYPVFDEEKSTAAKLIETGKTVTVYEVTRGQLVTACNLILKANDAKKTGDVISYMLFKEVNPLPNNGYRFNNDGKPRGKRGGEVITF